MSADAGSDPRVSTAQRAARDRHQFPAGRLRSARPLRARSSSGRRGPGAPIAPHGTHPEPILVNEWQAGPGSRGPFSSR